MTIPLSKDTVFPSGSIHELVVPNKVVELKENSIVLERPFEGSNEVPFFVSQADRVSLIPEGGHCYRCIPAESHATCSGIN